MSCNLGKTGTRFLYSKLTSVCHPILVFGRTFQALSKKTKDARDAFLESVYPCILCAWTVETWPWFTGNLITMLRLLNNTIRVRQGFWVSGITAVFSGIYGINLVYFGY